MGKIRRQRQKYHLSTNSPKSHLPLSSFPTRVCHTTREVINVVPEEYENVFAGIDISVDALNVRDDDARTVVSTSKSAFKGTSTSKLERGKLRHQTFIEKINAIQHAKHLKQKSKNKMKIVVSEIQTSCSDVLHQENNTQRMLKKKGTLKLALRQRQMLKDIAALKKQWQDPAFKSDPTGLISNLVQERISKEFE